MASNHLQHVTTTSPCSMELPALDKGLPEPGTASTGAFLAGSRDMRPVVTIQQASFHHLPPVNWNAHLLQGYQASHAARLQQRSGLLPHAHALAVTSSSIFSAAVLEVSPPISNIVVNCMTHISREQLSESASMNWQDALLKKDLQYLVEECQHNGRLADKRGDKVDAFIDSHLQEKKELQERLKVVHAWRKHVRGLRRRSSGREQYDKYSQQLKDGPPPGWEP
ncbi:hypothetical protein F4604DRAFT_1913505 [Suillus subluteus]|nr:hypothetical protein F4604DRAFT_1913505 [Suillus subluteus]